MRKLLCASGLCLLALLAGCGSGSDANRSDSAEQVPLPTFSVDSSLVPRSATIAGIDGGPERALGSIAGPTGGQADFVLNELTVVTADQSRVEALASKWHGKILKQTKFGPDGTPSLFLVEIDPSAASVAALPSTLQQIDKGARGAHRVSSEAALKLLAAAASEANAHQGDDSFIVGANIMLEPTSTWDGSSTEAATGSGDGYTPNAYKWGYMNMYHVPQAWDALSAAGKLGNKVKIMVLDGGFVPNPDFPKNSEIYGDWRTKNPATCTGGAICNWHGTDTVNSAMAQLDNGYGAAGPAGPVADLIAVQSPSYDVGSVFDWLGKVISAGTEGPRVINISATVKIPGIIGFTVKPVDWIVSAIRHIGKGALVFAAAGNVPDGQPPEDVDHQDCFGFCWETDVFFPCESDDVVCVAGTDWHSSQASPHSNFGSQQRVHYRDFANPGHQDNSVDFYGPFDVWTGPTPDDNGNIDASAGAHLVSGTSEATPFAAGVAALLFAAEPTLSADDAYAILLDTADSDIKLRINAYAAVKKALSKSNNPPQIVIDSPKTGASLGGGFPGVTFQASIKDFEDGQGCTVQWSSDKEGPIGSGTTMIHQFKTLGPELVTATVTDTQGASSQASVSFDLSDALPAAEIDAPTAGQTVSRGLPVSVQGKVLSDNIAMPCTWLSSNPADTGFPYQSCSGSVVFASNGTRTLTLTGKDNYGQVASTSVTIDVVDPPSNAPPGVAINAPAPETGVMWGNTLSLDGTAVDPGGQSPLSYEWRYEADGCSQQTVIASGAITSWDTSTAPWTGCGMHTVTGATISLYVTDPSNDTGVASVHVEMAVPPN